MAALAALACAAGFVTAYLLLVGRRGGRDLDIRLEQHAQTVSPSTHRAVAQLVDLLAPRHVAAAVALVVVALVVSRHWRQALVVVGGSGGTVVSVAVLKTHLVRPLDVGERIAGNSFPSGHVAVAPVLAGALLVAARGRLRPAVAVLGALLVTGMAYATVVLRWHRPSDGLGGVLLAGFFFAAAVVAVHVASAAASRVLGSSGRPASVAPLATAGRGPGA